VQADGMWREVHLGTGQVVQAYMANSQEPV